MTTEWTKDGIDPGWFQNSRMGSIRKGYRPGGWWFLPAWLPDSKEHDIGPFKTKAEAICAAEKAVQEKEAGE